MSSSVARLSLSGMRLVQLSRVSRRSPRQVRRAHTEAEHGAHDAHDSHGHGGIAPHGHLPFTYSNRRTFAVKFGIFCLTGFSLPFIATSYQLHKSGGAATA